jgi:hypothetical protein
VISAPAWMLQRKRTVEIKITTDLPAVKVDTLTTESHFQEVTCH